MILARPCGDTLTYWLTLPAVKTLADAVKVILPDTALGVSVAAGLVVVIVKAYLGMLSNVTDVAVHKESEAPRTILTGCKSGWTTISVSAD